ncbi:hypothetical protein FPZ41_32820 [Streptomyces sp. K1PN6]|uniref:Exo-alpha-sialidase n=1 Tax=Streptomyces acidicola TaxID=2596892 RepID=A0A5N8X0D7_9ACTN|nr:hypothetical protein [Streptomyces acidicola]
MEQQEQGIVGAHITLRVSRDGGRTWGPRVTYLPSRKDAPIESAGRFPPCECPRCGGEDGKGRKGRKADRPV